MLKLIFNKIFKALLRISFVGYFLLMCTMLKLLFINYFSSSADVGQMYVAGKAFIEGKDILNPINTGGNPSYFLFGHSLIVSACVILSEFFSFSFDTLIKIPAVLSDLMIAFILLHIPNGGKRIALIYMLNPLTFFLSVYNGQLHTVAVAGAIFSIWLMNQDRFVLSGFVLGLASIIRQHFSVLIVLLAKKSGRYRNMSIMVFFVVLILSNIPLFSSTHIKNVFVPVSNYGLWGYSMILNHGPRLLSLAGFNRVESLMTPLNNALELYGPGFYLIWALIFSIWYWYREPENEWSAGLFFLLGIYTIGTGFGVQRLIWVVPFWLIVSFRQGTIFCILASIYLIGSYWQWTLNDKYSVVSITQNLDVLKVCDLFGLIIVGMFGFLTWAYCARTFFQIWRKELVN
jgi:hypothetical protein